MWSAQEAVLAAPMDVEELARLGRRRGACPYYAARAALPEADLVLLPYAALLSQARPLQAQGLCLTVPLGGRAGPAAVRRAAEPGTSRSQAQGLRATS